MNPPPALEAAIEGLLAPGRGILAADESLPTIARRFVEVETVSTSETRQAWRELLITTPGLDRYISGVILSDDILRQGAGAGDSVARIAVDRGIIPGVKVDAGTTDLARFPGEHLTQGLDGLRDRLLEYRELGACFTKWRAVISVGESLPTLTCIQANARALAIFAAVSQEAGLVPMVEPEVLMNGRHGIARCEDVTTTALEALFEALFDHRVALEQVLLKTGMVVSGSECPIQARVEEVAEATLRCLRRTVPAAVPGILFLSGGQTEVIATVRLNAICSASTLPWKLSFSFGRALQAAALNTWRGIPAQAPAAQEALHHRAHCNAAAAQGRYTEAMEHGDGR